VIIMKKIGKFAFLSLKIAALLILTLFCLTETATVKDAVYEAVIRCLNTIIPSLYGMMVISALLTKSGITGKIPKAVSSFGKAVFGMDKNVFPIFLFSLFAGYPTGAKMLCSQYENNLISKKNAEIFSGLCFGAGPAFIYGCISSHIYGNENAGLIILISTVSANFILAIAVSFFIKTASDSQYCGINSLTLNSNILCDSVSSGGRSMASICTMILAFSVLTAFLRETGAISAIAHILCSFASFSDSTAEAVICAALDVTSCEMLPCGDYTLLPIICGLVSFGGVCILLQISALTSGKLSLLPLIILRTAAAFLSGLICHFISPYFLADTVISAAAINISPCRSSTPVPSLILIFMTFIVFYESDKLKTCSKQRKINTKFLLFH